MKNIQQANNGQIVYAEKAYSELTQQEKEKLTIPYTNKVEDFATFQIRYNKEGQLLTVKPHSFSAKFAKKLENKEQEIDLIDSLALLFAPANSKTYQAARKRSRLSYQDITKARRLVNKNK